ncbi:MAG: carbohydrate ABC transporter permease [Clostridia bacterium]|nr:carbohydrate ABC transporter permease [Clostridia bacterium]MBR4443590.1 carbohydrate ABC transporter permease [Clostridia bacterium]
MAQISSVRRDRSRSMLVFQILAKAICGLFALFCVLPFIMILSASFTSEGYIALNGYSLFIHDFSPEAYGTIFKDSSMVLRSYGVTIFITVVGTALALFIITMAAYVVSRKDFRYRNHFSFYFYFTTLFNGGLISTYILYVRYLGLKNSIWAMILPGLFSTFYMIVMRSFMSEIPSSLVESAKIDGAGEFRIYFRIIIPLTRSGLITIGLFIALGYWNEWYNCMLYITDERLFPLQYLLYNMLASQQALARIASKTAVKLANMPSKSMRMAMTVIAVGPVLLAYPFIQKYFVKGITVGAVKG